MSKKIGALKVQLATSPTIGEHITIEISNTKFKEYFTGDEDNVKIRISLDTAGKLVDFIDEALEELAMAEMKGNV